MSKTVLGPIIWPRHMPTYTYKVALCVAFLTCLAF